MLRMQTVGTRIQERREALGLSQASLAERIGVSRQAVSQWESDVRRPASQKMGELAAILTVPADWLWTGRGQSDGTVKLSPKALIATERPIPEVVYPAGPRRGSVKDLPVYGSAEGGDGVMLLDNEPIEFIERPPELDGVKSAFAVYIRNDSMAPVYLPGDRAFVHPAKPLRVGRNALFVRADPDGTRHALVKRFVGQTAKIWRVQQFTPAKSYDLPKQVWQQAFRIIGSIDAD